MIRYRDFEWNVLSKLARLTIHHITVAGPCRHRPGRDAAEDAIRLDIGPSDTGVINKGHLRAS